MPAQGHDPAAGAAHVAQQQLDDRRGADDLHADRVLRPADRVAERRRALAAGVLAQRLRDLEELLLRAAADLGDALGGVAAVVALQQLEDAARVLERRVLLRGLAVLEPGPVAAVTHGLAAERGLSSWTAPRTRIPAYCQVVLS